MTLKWRFFIDGQALANFINNNNIKKENIQKICITQCDHFELFYWK